MRLIKIVAALGAAIVALAVSAPAAQAAAPANDDVSGAIAITVPSTVQADTSEATVAADDPRNACVGPLATVWYSLTLSSPTRVQLDTVGSDYDTTLAVFTGAPGSLEPVACNDDRFDLASAVRFDAAAGTTYLVMAGTCCGGETGDIGPGGHLVLNASVAPEALEAALAIDRRATVTRSGVVTVTGTLTCSRAAISSDLSVALSQALGRFVARGFGGTGDPGCEPEGTPWQIQVTSENGVLFGGGRAHASVDAFVSDGLEFVQLSSEATLRLHRG